MTNLEVDKFLEAQSARYARAYQTALDDMLVAIGTGNAPAARDARMALEAIMVETMGQGEVLGASMMLRSTAKLLAEGDGVMLRRHAQAHMHFAVSAPMIPNVTFEEAVQDMIERTPVTIRRAAERSGAAIAKRYSEGRVVAFARSAEAAVTKRVQSLIAQAIREGISEVNIGARIVSDVDLIRKRTAAWSENYARMAFRTNLNTAVTAGRFRQAQDQDIRAVVPAFAFDDVGDSDTRDNHKAPRDLIFKVDNTVWNTIAPPLGYNCRCQVRPVSVPQLFRLGRIDASGDIKESKVPGNLRPDDGFRHGGRPDLFMVG